jgi:uncharacterized protein (TIGR00269 family)
VDLESHHTAFCTDCFFTFVERQVKRSVSEHRMLQKGERVLVCVSGGKDSLALWEILVRLGHEADGLYIDLGIPGYSERSGEKVARFAGERGLRHTAVSLAALGIPIPELARRSRRAECSVCGTVKRHFFNRMALQGGYAAVATGHNLDDETGRLLGNLLHWQWDYLAKQNPVLPRVGDMLVKRVEPLCRLSERETAAYAILRGIDYILDECPMSRGATSLRYKQILNLIEDWMPGTKANFYHGFLKSAHLFRGVSSAQDPGPARRCSACGSPAYLDPCNYCRLTALRDDRNSDPGGDAGPITSG